MKPHFNRKHGHRSHDESSKTYQCWVSMKNRCSQPKTANYGDYGGRGIKVCERWSSFENFLADMGERPSEIHSLDRVDSNGDYCPENCRWATRKEQARNKKSNSLFTFGGETMCLMEWSERLNIKYHTLSKRLLKSKWTVERAFTSPVRETTSER